ncbi:protein timeless homolog [Parasteatoda tepidariorum]|uniref:protein timeless homolog n=1 Tax=Parasteatoda tepidariorum TaxID=114398 RepID=UPI001C717CAF|nr:protein timeless homolog [Parasteatoda tepidariorum]
MNHLIEADILATCNALGTEVTGVYEKGVECLECLRDLLRYLRKDDDNHSVLRFLGSIRLVQTDLLPLLKRYEQDDEIFDFVLRLLVALSSPAILLFKEEIPEDKLSHNVYLQLVSYLQTYKDAFTDADAWNALSKRLQNLLETRSVERSEAESLTIERILILIRNILHIPTDDRNLTKTDSDLSSHDKVLLSLRKSKIDVSILYLCANEEEKQFSLHVLEIVSLMLREHSAETLALSNEQRSAAEKEKDVHSLVSALQREQSMKVKNTQSMITSRFNGVYSVKNMKSLSDKDYISHKLITNMEDVKFDSNKNAKRKPKNRLPPKDVDQTRQSTLTVRLFLKNFCKEFLKTYNKLMALVKKELIRKSSGDHDDSYYLWAIEYFMKFNRHYKFQPDFVSETISVQIFHHIQTQITDYLEMMMADKKKAKVWSKRMQLGVSAYKELLQTLRAMTQSSDSNIKRNADIVISNIFYVIEYREMLLSLLTHYDEVKFPLSYLAELVESAYLFLKMLEDHSKRNSEIIIQKKKRKIRRRKKKSQPLDQTNTAETIEEKWVDISSELSAAVQDRRSIPKDISPFDGASQVEFEEQKIEAVYKIRNALFAKEANKAVGLLRAARDLWPEGDSFGSPDIESEDEFCVLREIFLSDLTDPGHAIKPATEDPDLAEYESDEEEESLPAVTEQKLDINEIYNKYATHKVVIPCCLLLNNYQGNSRQTNSCLIKFLHRIAWSCKMHALFFQATVFLTFQRIFRDPDSSRDPLIKEFFRFGKFIMRKFFETAEKNKKAFVEILFWKGTREAYELEEGYGEAENRSNKIAWTEDEEEELKYLFEENQNIYIEGQDIADLILVNLHKKRTKLQIISALKRLGLIQNVKDLKPQLRKEWQEAEIIDLQNLYEDHKLSDDVMTNILNRLSIKRSRKAVVEKLLELNIIQDRKEVLKKKSKKKNNSNSSGSDSDVEPEEDFWSKSNKNKSQVSSDDDAEEDFFRSLKADKENTTGIASIEENENLDSAQEKFANSDNESNKIWDESEIFELNKFFNENKDSEDILSILCRLLTVKRKKKEIVEKLLELNLINDKEMLKKSNKTKKKDKKVIQSDDESVNSETITHKKSKKFRQILSDDSEDESTKSSDKNKQKQVKKRPPKVWDESEIIELHKLFEECKNDNDSVGNIFEKQTMKRPKPLIIEKLLELGLIKDRKEIRKKKESKASQKLESTSELNTKQNKKQLSKVWEENEVIELHELFQKNKDSKDIVGNIMKQQTIKRPKPIIIEKMLELGLIKDRKEVRKKRETKSSKGKKNKESESSSDNDDVPLTVLANTSKASQKPESSTESSSNQNKKQSSKVWEKNEVIELRELFQKNKGRKDIVGNIMRNQTVKRPKPIIIEKMLDLGLIKDRKEVRIRRESEEAKNKESDSSSSDDDDNVPLTLITNTPINIPKVWQEEEIIELQLLFEENKTQSDLLDKVISKMKIHRTEKDVAEKLSELGLISNEKNLEKTESGGKYVENLVSAKMHKKKRKIIEDSSDEEDLRLDSLSTKSASVSLSDMNTENLDPNSLDDVVGVHKRKRLRINLSDDSDDDISAPRVLVNEHEITDTNVMKLNSPIKQTAPFSSKKRIRVLQESDESD